MRRLKEFVETIPPMEETLVMVGLMPMQCKVYRALYDGSLRTLLGRDSSKRKSELRNLGMQLRKVCCHPVSTLNQIACSDLDAQIKIQSFWLRSRALCSCSVKF